MPTPGLLLGDAAREPLKRGFDTLARVLALTLGPTPRTILTTSYQRALPEALEDAATIARRMLSLPDRAESAGAMLLRHMVWKQHQRVGDGCAIAAVLAQALLAELHRMLAAGVDYTALRFGVEAAVAEATKLLEAAARPLDCEAELEQFTASVCVDPALSRLVAELFDLLGPDASITVERFAAPFLEREYLEGGRWKARLASPYFAQTEPKGPLQRSQVILHNPAVIIVAGDLREQADVLRMLEVMAAQQYRGLLIIVQHIEDPALTTLVVNHQRGDLPIAVVELREVGERREQDAADLAALTGATLINSEAGEDLRTLTLGQIGRARRVEVHAESLCVAGWRPGPSVRQRIGALQARLQVLEQEAQAELVADVRQRIGRLATGTALLKIGAHSDIEREILERRAEQCLRVLPVAMRQGVLPGGGVAYIDVAARLRNLAQVGEQGYGVQAVARALHAPMYQIVTNAGLRDPSTVLAEVARHGSGWGYHAVEDTIVPLAECGILDSAVVLVAALQTAASCAFMALSTEALVLKRNPETSMEP